MVQKKHSVLGIISIFMPVISVLIYGWFHFTGIGEKYFNYDLIAPYISYFALALPLLGIFFAIFPIIRKNKNLFFPIIGFAINFVAVLLETLFIIVMIKAG